MQGAKSAEKNSSRKKQSQNYFKFVRKEGQTQTKTAEMAGLHIAKIS